MNFSVIGPHRDFFRIHRKLECAEILSTQRLVEMEREISNILSEREKGRKTFLPVDRDFIEGYDLWRGSGALRKVVLQKALAQIASELIEYKPLRFGYDQLFTGVGATEPFQGTYATFLDQTFSLQEMSSIQGVVCGAMLCLKAPENVSESKSDPIPLDVFSVKAGNAVYFAPDVPVDWGMLKHLSGGAYLLLAYVKAHAVYYRQENDPHLHSNKHLGYNFGDRLQEKLHPFVYQ